MSLARVVAGSRLAALPSLVFEAKGSIEIPRLDTGEVGVWESYDI